MPAAETAQPGITTPCNHVCVVHPVRQICIGCGRSLGEIARWAALSEAERTAIMAELPARLAAIDSGSRAAARTGR
jgi:uncharacterized protein